MDRVPRLGLVVVLVLAASTTGVSGVIPAEGTPSSPGADAATGEVADAPPPRTPPALNRTPNRLGLGDGPTTSGFLTPSADLHHAVTIGDRELRGQFLAYQVIERYQAARTAAANRSVIVGALEAVERRIDTLRERERAAVRAYYEGRIDERELLGRLAELSARARVYRRSLTTLKRSEEINYVYDLDNRLVALKGELETFEMPLREQVRRTLRGNGSSTRVHVVASASGLVLETVRDGHYVRETVRFDHYAPENPPSAGLNEALMKLREFYPLLWNESSSVDSTEYGSRLWRWKFSYPLGTTHVYLGHSTGEIYRERHSLSLRELPTTTVANHTDDGLRILVNRTGGANPLRITVLDARTGRPIDATVSVGNYSLGTTNARGSVWGLAPRGSFDVTVSTEVETVNVSVGG